MQKSQFLFILGLILAIIVTIFALTNASPVVLNLFFYKFTASQALIIFLSATLGAITVILLGIVSHFKLVREVHSLHKSNDELIKQNKSLLSELGQTASDKSEAQEEKETDDPPSIY
ncbi:MAG: LapA family protein [Eubacteriales bacterium]